MMIITMRIVNMMMMAMTNFPQIYPVGTKAGYKRSVPAEGNKYGTN